MIGERIRQLRLKKGLSLTAFAERAGMSKSMISQLERANVNPSVETARALAAALEVPLFTLFLEDGQEHGALVRRQDRVTLSVPGSKAVRELLVPDLNREMVLLASRIPPGEASSPTHTIHRGEECVVVLHGTLEVHLQDETYILCDGDALYFDALQPHYFRNPADDAEVEFLSAITPPTIMARRV